MGRTTGRARAALLILVTTVLASTASVAAPPAGVLSIHGSSRAVAGSATIFNGAFQLVVGVPQQTIDLVVDGTISGSATTDNNGAYQISAAIDGVGSHQVHAALLRGTPAEIDSETLDVTVTGAYEPVVTAAEHIQQDVADGSLDLPTSLLYRAYSLLDPARLPDAYAGDTLDEDLVWKTDVEQAWDTLPADIKAKLQPYLVRPTDPTSVFASAAPDLVPTPAPGRRGAPAPTPPKDGVCRTSGVGKGWLSASSQNGYPYEVWVQCNKSGVPVDARALADANTTVSYLDAAWNPEFTFMGKVVPDAGTTASNKDAGDDNRTDVYVVFPPGVQQQNKRDKTLTQLGNDFSAGAVLPDAPQGADGSSASYVVFNRIGIAATVGTDNARAIRGAIYHELFHVFQNAWNQRVTAKNSPNWFSEASAVWATTHFDPQDRDFDLPDFTKYYWPAQKQLDLDVFAHKYGAFAWPFYMEKEKGADSIAAVWKSLPGKAAGDFDAILQAINAQVPFKDKFRDFGVRALDNGIHFSNDSSYWTFKDKDAMFPEQTVAQTPIVNQGASDINAKGKMTLGNVLIPHLTTHTWRFTPKDDSLRYFRLDLSGLSGERDVDILVHLRSGRWERRKRASGDPLKIDYCRDDSADNFDDMFVVVTNHSMDPSDGVLGSFTMDAQQECIDDIQGTLTVKFHHKLSYVQGNVSFSYDEIGTIPENIHLRFDRAQGTWVDQSGTWGNVIAAGHGSVSGCVAQLIGTLQGSGNFQGYDATVQGTGKIAAKTNRFANGIPNTFEIDSSIVPYSVLVVVGCTLVITPSVGPVGVKTPGCEPNVAPRARVVIDPHGPNEPPHWTMNTQDTKCGTMYTFKTGQVDHQMTVTLDVSLVGTRTQDL